MKRQRSSDRPSSATDRAIGRRGLLVGMAMLGCSLLGTSPARAITLEQALDRITAARTTLKTLQAAFRQTRQIGLLAAEVESKGAMTMVRPDRLRWELKPPDSVTYWIGPEGFAMATADGVVRVGAAAAGRFGAVLGDIMIMLGGDLRKLRERYALEASEVAGRLALVAKPREDTNPEVCKHLSLLRLEFGAELWLVTRMVIEERNGDRSTIVFESVKRDVPVPPEHMKPPAKR
jgi:outer membrane lipoprotein-sorting protein